MDIFAIAQEGMKIQEEEIKEKEQEEVAEKEEKKKYKLDLFREVLPKIAEKDYSWLGRDDETHTSEEKRKGFEPFVVNMFMAKMWNTKNPGKAINNTDLGYFQLLTNSNEFLNKNIFWCSKEMSWLLACTVNPFDAYFVTDRINFAPKGISDKFDKRVIKYMARELWSSDEKIEEMINAGLISEEDMNAIAADLDTLEENGGKKTRKKK